MPNDPSLAEWLQKVQILHVHVCEYCVYMYYVMYTLHVLLSMCDEFPPIQPCPPPTMDLTLVSANQFVSSSCLASMQDHMVILTKSTEHAQSAAAAAAKSKFL